MKCQVNSNVVFRISFFFNFKRICLPNIYSQLHDHGYSFLVVPIYILYRQSRFRLIFRRFSWKKSYIFMELELNRFIYRVSHETWQLLNSFWMSSSYTVLDIRGCLQFFFVKKSFAQIYFRINFAITWLLYNISIIVFGIKQSNKIM